MPDISGAKLPGHLSHSSRETLERCAKAWFLKYMTPAPRRPALWAAGGVAVHEATEKYDHMALAGQESAFYLPFIWERLFGTQLDKARIADPNENNWNRSPSEPIEVWNTNGPAFVRSYIDWRQRSPYEIWTTPDGSPAIELDVSGQLPGCPIPVHGYVDRIFHDPVLDKLIIVDLKTGKRPPATVAQFATYAALVRVKYGVQADIGVAFMNRKGTLATPWDLGGVTPESVGQVFGETWDKIQAGEFPADGFPKACYPCDMVASCAAANGPLAHLYDPDAQVPF